MPKTLTDWLAYAETLTPNPIQLGLDRIAGVAQKLGVRTFVCPVITVAGTNGKGSCVAFLSSIFQRAGYRVGAYTSPHLLTFHERVRINGACVSDEELLAAFAVVERARGSVLLTFFEWTTLLALVLFQQAALDVIVLEVGLGGRLDAVNCVEPDVAIITTVAMDHMDWLGNTREAIAREKAGIFRSGKPAICGDVNPPDSIYEAAEAIGAPLFCMHRDFTLERVHHFWEFATVVKLSDGRGGAEAGGSPQATALNLMTDGWRAKNLPIPHLPLQNAATALMGLHCLQNRLPVTLEAIQQGLCEAFLPGRFQHFSKPCPIILDVAHNPAAAHLLAERLQAEKCQGKTLAVVSILGDKDIPQTLAPLLPWVDNWYSAGLDVPRGISADTMAQHLRNLGIRDFVQRSCVLDAFKMAVSACGARDRVLVFGSFHTVEPVLRFLLTTDPLGLGLSRRDVKL